MKAVNPTPGQAAHREFIEQFTNNKNVDWEVIGQAAIHAAIHQFEAPKQPSDPTDPTDSTDSTTDSTYLRFCNACGKHTVHIVHDSGHERDSSHDWKKCTECEVKVYGCM